MKKIIILSSCALLLSALLCGCGRGKAVWKPLGDDNSIKIALLGSDGDFQFDAGIIDGMEMAAEEINEKTGWSVIFEKYDDEGEYNKGVSMAENIISDNNISATITVQGFDILNAIADIYDKAGKPLFITQGCYDSTSGGGYGNVISDCTTAETTGMIMGSFAVKKGYSNIAYCHTDTEFEKDELKGFQSMINSSENEVRIVDSMVGPFTQEEFGIAYKKWQTLNVDAVCISFYSQTLGCEMIKTLREMGSDLPVIIDYGMLNDDNIENFGKYFDNIYVTTHYPCVRSSQLDDFEERFIKQYGYLPSAYAVQSYDLINIIFKACSTSKKAGTDMIEIIKFPEGFDSVAGKIAFDDNGVLKLNTDNDIYVFNKDHFEKYFKE